MYVSNEITLKEIKKNLLEDLRRRIGIDINNFDIDFSDALGEGSGVYYNGEFLECSSDIGIVDKNNNLTGEGWIDHLLDQNNKLYSYWAYFSFKYNGQSVESKTHSIPDYLWEELSEETKHYLAKTHQGWHGDKKLLPYRIQHYPQELKSIYEEAIKIVPEIRELGLTNEASNALDSLLRRSEKYLRGRTMKRKNERDVYYIENSLRFKLFALGKSRKNIELLDKLENILNACQIVMPQLPKNYLDITEKLKN